MRLNNVFFLGIDCLREILNQQSTLNFDLFFLLLEEKIAEEKTGKVRKKREEQKEGRKGRKGKKKKDGR